MRWIACKQHVRHIVTNSLAIFLLVAFFTWVIPAQSSRPVRQPSKQDDVLLGCDEGVARQDIVVSHALEKLKDDSLLFVILRQGTGELSEKLAKQRLYNLHQYFKERGSRLPAEKVMIAVGQPVTGFGRIEYYIDGRLHEKLLYPKNGYVCHSCCGPDESYYPEKDRTKKRKAGKKRL